MPKTSSSLAAEISTGCRQLESHLQPDSPLVIANNNDCTRVDEVGREEIACSNSQPRDTQPALNTFEVKSSLPQPPSQDFATNVLTASDSSSLARERTNPYLCPATAPSDIVSSSISSPQLQPQVPQVDTAVPSSPEPARSEKLQVQTAAQRPEDIFLAIQLEVGPASDTAAETSSLRSFDSLVISESGDPATHSSQAKSERASHTSSRTGITEKLFGRFALQLQSPHQSLQRAPPSHNSTASCIGVARTQSASSSSNNNNNNNNTGVGELEGGPFRFRFRQTSSPVATDSIVGQSSSTLTSSISRSVGSPSDNSGHASATANAAASATATAATPIPSNARVSFSSSFSSTLFFHRFCHPYGAPNSSTDTENQKQASPSLSSPVESAPVITSIYSSSLSVGSECSLNLSPTFSPSYLASSLSLLSTSPHAPSISFSSSPSQLPEYLDFSTQQSQQQSQKQAAKIQSQSVILQPANLETKIRSDGQKLSSSSSSFSSPSSPSSSSSSDIQLSQVIMEVVVRKSILNHSDQAAVAASSRSLSPTTVDGSSTSPAVTEQLQQGLRNSATGGYYRANGLGVKILTNLPLPGRGSRNWVGSYHGADSGSFDPAALKLSGSADGKLVIVGDAGVGKTSLLRRYVADEFSSRYLSTIGVDFCCKRYRIFEYGNFELRMWDTAGQDRFRSVSRAYFRGAQAIIFAFDLTNRHSFENIRTWLSETMQVTTAFIPFLVGCKGDLPGHVVNESEIEDLAHSISAEYFQVSAKTGENVNWLFERIAALLWQRGVLDMHERTMSRSPIELGNVALLDDDDAYSVGRNTMRMKSSCCLGTSVRATSHSTSTRRNKVSDRVK